MNNNPDTSLSSITLIESKLNALLHAVQHQCWEEIFKQIEFFFNPDTYLTFHVHTLEELVHLHQVELGSLYLELCFQLFVSSLKKNENENENENNSFHLLPLTPFTSTSLNDYFTNTSDPSSEKLMQLALWIYHFIQPCLHFNLHHPTLHEIDLLMMETEALHWILWIYLSHPELKFNNALHFVSALIRIAEDVLSFALSILALIHLNQNQDRVLSVFQEACKIIQIRTTEQFHQFVTMVHCTVNYINSLSAVLPTLQAFLQRLPSMEYQEHCAMLLEWLEIYFNHIETTKKKKEPIPMFEVNSTSIEHGSMQFFDHALDHSLHTMKTMLQKNELSVDTLQSFLFNHFVHPTTLALKHWQQLRSCLNYIYWINSFSDGEHCKLLHLAFKLPSFENILGPIKEYCALLITYRISNFTTPLNHPVQFQLIVYVSCMNIKFSTLVDENEGTNGGHETKLRCIWFEKAVAAYLGFLNHTFDDVKGHDINLHLLFKELMNTWLELELSLCVRTLEQLLKILIQTKEYALLITFIFWVDKNHPFLKYATWEEWAALIIYEKCPSTVQLTVAQCVLQAYIKDIDAEKALHFNTRIALWFRVVIKSALVRNEKVALDFLQQLPELLEIIQFPETEVIWLIQVAWNTALDFTSLSNLEALKWGEIAIQIARVLQYEHLKMMQDQFRTMKLELEQDT